MTMRWIAALIVFAAALSHAQAQSDRQARLAYRFVPGQVTQEQARVTGELRVVAGGNRTPITIDAVTLSTRRVSAVSSAGEATVIIHLDSNVARISADGQTLFSLQDQKSIATLADGVALTPLGQVPKDITVRIGRSGQMSAVSDAGDDPVSKLLGGAPMSAFAFPDRDLAVGERWRNAARRASPPAGQVGGIALAIPEMAVTSESELRSLQDDQGRLVATILTTLTGTSKDGTSSQRATVTTRFDVGAGELIETSGDLSVDLKLSGSAATAGSEGEGRLVGQMHFATTVLASRMAAAETAPAAPEMTSTPSRQTQQPPTPPQPQAIVLTPPFGEGGRLAEPRDNWTVSGGEILRYYGSPNAEACRQDCAKDVTCRAYTWVKPSGYRAGDPPVCYLMRSFANVTQHTCCVSATKDPYPGAQPPKEATVVAPTPVAPPPTVTEPAPIRPTAPSPVTPPAADSVAELFQHYGLVGTWAPDCSKPPSEDNQYVTYRIDGEKVRREVASGDANAADVRAVDQADGTEPGEIFVHLADPKFDMTFLFKVEPNRHRIWTMSLNNQMLIISGRRASDKVELPWINRCGG